MSEDCELTEAEQTAYCFACIKNTEHTLSGEKLMEKRNLFILIGSFQMVLSIIQIILTLGASTYIASVIVAFKMILLVIGLYLFCKFKITSIPIFNICLATILVIFLVGMLVESFVMSAGNFQMAKLMVCSPVAIDFIFLIVYIWLYTKTLEVKKEDDEGREERAVHAE